jgi:hypothetical protein
LAATVLSCTPIRRRRSSFSGREVYARERDAYLLLHAAGITSIAGHKIPHFIRADDDLLAIEMTIVKPPFLLDFASAYPELEAPDFPEEIWENWRAEKAEQFGDRLRAARALTAYSFSRSR